MIWINENKNLTIQYIAKKDIINTNLKIILFIIADCCKKLNNITNLKGWSNTNSDLNFLNFLN